jgi:hypothetical protein
MVEKFLWKAIKPNYGKDTFKRLGTRRRIKSQVA